MATVARVAPHMQFGTLTLEQWDATLSRRRPAATAACSSSSSSSSSSPRKEQCDEQASPAMTNAGAAGADAGAAVATVSIATPTSLRPPRAPTWADRVASGRAGVERPHQLPVRWEQMHEAKSTATADATTCTTATDDEKGRVEEVPRRRVRGLVNCGNSCFINAVLQALMACEPFRRWLLTQRRDDAAAPLTAKFVRLAEEMSEDDAGVAVEEEDAEEEDAEGVDAVVPDWMLDIFQPGTAHAGSQQDAEEFLTYVLNALHEEQVGLRGGKAAHGRETDEEGWEEMTRGGRSVHIRGGGWAASAVTEVFGGTLRGEVRRAGEKASVTREPFWTLSVDVEGGDGGVQHALQRYLAATEVQRGVQRVVSVCETPRVLVLQLKRFRHNGATGALEKTRRVLALAESLSLGAARYALRAVVTHQGRSLATGHYTCDVRAPPPSTSSCWLACDDARVLRVPLRAVLRRPAYLLFYCRAPN
ncbi:unnamed protein product [Agarophyton chilense]